MVRTHTFARRICRNAAPSSSVRARPWRVSRSRSRPLPAHGHTSMSSVLVAEEELAGAEHVLEDLVCPDLIRWRRLEQLDRASRQAYERYLLFSNEAARRALGLKNLSRQDIFYNSYYWVLIFSRRYQSRYGQDLGVERQAFLVLGNAPPNVDWDVVVDIMQAARQA